MAEPVARDFFADEADPVDQDFLHHLYRGSELLAAGDLPAARESLERALRLQPASHRGQSLLALSYFKLGMFDRAAGVYRALIDEHPADATLRVNLGLVHLKTVELDLAARCFESALDLNPGHKKALQYLGLAYLQKNDHARAREAFLRAGNEQMAARMAQALASGPLRDVAAEGLGALDGTHEPLRTVALEEPPQMRKEADEAWVVTQPARSFEDSAGTLGSFTDARKLELPPPGAFGLTTDLVGVEVMGEVFTRVDGLVAVIGDVKLVPELKRFRGQATDKPFGDGPRRMMRASGSGRLLVARGRQRFTALDLGGDPAYFREEVLWAFEESLVFENGRIPSRVGGDLHLVHLRGNGRLLLATDGLPRGVQVQKEHPLQVPPAQLVGWFGMLTPRVTTLSDEGGAAGPLVVVELTGDGHALVNVTESGAAS